MTTGVIEHVQMDASIVVSEGTLLLIAQTSRHLLSRAITPPGARRSSGRGRKRRISNGRKANKNTLISKSLRLQMFCYLLLDSMFQVPRQTPAIQILRMRHPRRRQTDFASSLTPASMVGYVLWPWRVMHQPTATMKLLMMR
jgi:hypothetical protein